jgi:hypothetical protein
MIGLETIDAVTVISYWPSKMLHQRDVALHTIVRARTPMVLKSKYDEAIYREESLKAELEASRHFVGTQLDDYGRAQSSQQRSKSVQLFIDTLQLQNQEPRWK